jgi:hypothetical protein
VHVVGVRVLCRDRLVPTSRSRWGEVVECLPNTAAGKVSNQDLRAPLLAHRGGGKRVRG